MTSREEEPIIIVRNARKNDAAQIASVHNRSWIVTYPNESIGLTKEDIEALDLESEAKLRKWELSIERQNEHKKIWVTETEDGEITGYAIATKDPKQSELNAIYVTPECVGSGVGNSLMQTVLQWIGKKNEIIVWVFTHNERAIRFYERHGFRKSGKTSTWPVGLKNIPDLEMVRKPIS